MVLASDEEQLFRPHAYPTPQGLGEEQVQGPLSGKVHPQRVWGSQLTQRGEGHPREEDSPSGRG